MRDFLARGGLWVVAQAVVLAAAFGMPYVLPDSVLPWPPGTRAVREVAGVGLMVAGLLEMALGALRLGRGLTPLPKPTSNASLVRSGIFARVRHPIYGGIVLLGIGALLRDASMLPLPLAV
ncbi:MAG TPA: methyltransferase, partial [Fimbriimonas sp.]